MKKNKDNESNNKSKTVDGLDYEYWAAKGIYTQEEAQKYMEEFLKETGINDIEEGRAYSIAPSTQSFVQNIEILEKDYDIFEFKENKKEVNIKIKMKNMEKLNLIQEQLIKNISFELSLHFNTKKYTVGGEYYNSVYLRDDCDFIFPINEKGKIKYSKENVIHFFMDKR